MKGMKTYEETLSALKQNPGSFVFGLEYSLAAWGMTTDYFMVLDTQSGSAQGCITIPRESKVFGRALQKYSLEILQGGLLTKIRNAYGVSLSMENGVQTRDPVKAWKAKSVGDLSRIFMFFGVFIFFSLFEFGVEMFFCRIGRKC